MKTFWNNKHELCEESERLGSELMPISGNCETIEGELYRASSRLSYDYYNNGFCNNWSGALEFLARHDMVTVREHSVLCPYRFGNLYESDMGFYEDDCPLQQALVAIHERVIERVLEKEGNLTPNTQNVDMFDFQERAPSGWEDEYYDY